MFWHSARPTDEENPVHHEILFHEIEAVYSWPGFGIDNLPS